MGCDTWGHARRWLLGLAEPRGLSQPNQLHDFFHSPCSSRSSDPPRNLRLQSFTESSQGTATILLCVVDSHPPAQLTLLRGGHPVASSPLGGGDTPRPSPRVSPSPNALRLELRETSEEDEGQYECQARSALGVTNASLTLRVQGEEGDKGVGDTQGGHHP